MPWHKVGTVKKGKENNYLQMDEDVTLKKGQKLQLYNPRKSKFMTEERLAKLPEFILAEAFMPPDKDETPAKEE